MRQLSFLLVIVPVGLFAGCAIGKKITYDEVTPSLRASAPLVVAVAVDDRRPDVVSDGRPLAFVGVLRAGFGNTFPVTTTSGKPLADDFANTVVRGLSARGFRATKVTVSPDERPDHVVARLARIGADRLLLLEMTEWKSDTYTRTALMYDVTALVLDVPQARLLGQSRITGRDNLGGSFWDPGAHAKTAVPPAYQKELELLLNAPAIVGALAATATVPAAPALAPSPSGAPVAPAAPSPPKGSAGP